MYIYIHNNCAPNSHPKKLEVLVCAADHEIKTERRERPVVSPVELPPNSNISFFHLLNNKWKINEKRERERKWKTKTKEENIQKGTKRKREFII